MDQREETASQVSEALPAMASSARLAPQIEASYRGILTLAAPLVLSTTGFMLMHLLDAIFLAKHSKEAIAASVPAGMAGFTLVSFFSGVTGYVGTFVAQYMGARRPERIGAAVWQALYLSLAAAVITAALGFLADPLFRLVGHEPGLQAIEVRYFQIMCWTALLPFLSVVLSAFYVGRGDNTTVMVVQLCGLAINGVLSYAFIFGRFGLPSYGAPGAAWATAIAQGFVVIPLAILFLRPVFRRTYRTWSARAFDGPLLKRLIRFGLPDGTRFTVEMVAFTLFVFIVGRLGTAELAATNISWRINGFAFFPLIGLSRAIATVVGHAQGRNEPHVAERATYRGLLISQGWMLFAAALFLLVPRPMLQLFTSEGENPEEAARALELGVELLRFVALYCVVDGLNIVFLGALQGAGDTRWTSAVAVSFYAVFVGVQLAMDHYHATLYQLWTVMTFFVMAQALIWLARFRAGHWKKMRVIEPSMKDEG